MAVVHTIVFGAIGSLIAGLILYWFPSTRKVIKNIKPWLSSIKLAMQIRKNGLTKFHFSRDDYGRTLSTFLKGAQSSIEIVSISMKVTDEGADVAKIFRDKLVKHDDFRVRVSLRNPDNRALMTQTAQTLGIEPKRLRSDIREVLQKLTVCYNNLSETEQCRFQISVHDCTPMASVIMLDAKPEGGMIQIETKLHGLPIDSSFGFQVTKKSSFYERHFNSWQSILNRSTKII